MKENARQHHNELLVQIAQKFVGIAQHCNFESRLRFLFNDVCRDHNQPDQPRAYTPEVLANIINPNRKPQDLHAAENRLYLLFCAYAAKELETEEERAELDDNELSSNADDIIAQCKNKEFGGLPEIQAFGDYLFQQILVKLDLGVMTIDEFNRKQQVEFGNNSSPDGVELPQRAFAWHFNNKKQVWAVRASKDYNFPRPPLRALPFGFVSHSQKLITKRDKKNKK